MEDAKFCAAEGCHQPLSLVQIKREGQYCSRSCSNRARAGLSARPTPEEKHVQPVIQVIRSGGIPKEMELALYDSMGVNEASMVLHEIQSQIALRLAEPGPQDRRTRLKPPTSAAIDPDIEHVGYYPLGGGNYLSDFRRDTAIGFEDIELMERCGIMVFASRMKKSSIITSLSNPRYWLVKSPDEKLATIATANLVNVFHRHAGDIMTALDNGAAFMAKEWAQKTAEEIGIEEGKGVDMKSKWWVLDKLHLAYPETVPEVLRSRTDLSFKGFAHERKLIEPKTVEILVPQALVITHNGRYGNIWGRSIYEPVYDYWFWYEITMRAFMRYLERMGTPVAVCKAPSRGTVQRPDGTIVNAAEWAMVVAGNVGRSSAAYIPSDLDLQTGQPLWSLEYLAADQRGEQFVKALEMLGTWIMRGMIVGDRAATQSSDVGSYAAAEVHSGWTELDNDLIYKEIVGQINRWLLPDYGRYNVNPNTPPPIQLVTEGLDPREKDRIMRLVATAGNQKLGAGSPFDWLDWVTMFKAVDLPVLTDEERKKMTEQSTEEALDKQKKFNELQAETQSPAAPSPFSGKKPASSAEAQQKEQGAPRKQPGAAQLAVYDAISDGHLIPVLLSRDEVQDITWQDVQESIAIRTHDINADYTNQLGAMAVIERLAMNLPGAKLSEDTPLMPGPYWIAGQFSSMYRKLAAGGYEADMEAIKLSEPPELDERVLQDFIVSEADYLVLSNSDMIHDLGETDLPSMPDGCLILDKTLAAICLGIPDPQGHVELFNPYHDKAGRFTSAPAGGVLGAAVPARVGLFGSGKYEHEPGKTDREVKFHKEIPQEKRTELRAELDKQEAYLKKNVSGFDGEASIEFNKSRLFGAFMAGAYYPGQDRISLSHKWTEKNDIQAKQIMLHEQLHSRRTINYNAVFANVQAHEAANELMTYRTSREMYGSYKEWSAYKYNARRLGNYAMRKYNGDTKKAWEFVNDMQRGQVYEAETWEAIAYMHTRGTEWKQMVEYKGKVKLEEVVMGVDLDSLPDEERFDIAFWEYIKRKDWDGAMKFAQDAKKPEYVAAVIDMAALHDITFEGLLAEELEEDESE